MKTKLIKIAILAVVSCIGLDLVSQSSVIAVNDVCSSDAPGEVKKAAGCSGGGDELPNVIANILNVIIGISGLISVAFIIIGGVQYMTSAGDAAKTKQAKNTILYAVIGLIICALAFAIVNWVILGLLNQKQ